jgi:hypothetical protein
LLGENTSLNDEVRNAQENLRLSAGTLSSAFATAAIAISNSSLAYLIFSGTTHHSNN